ncbi:MAG: M48 family metallopeptidase [Candidatus Woesearchaeota archaeon]
MAKLVHFDEVRNNNIKSFVLILLFLLMVAGFGYLVGLLWGNILVGITVTLVIGIIYSLIAYFSGRNMVMSIAGAKEVSKKEYPHLYHTVEGLSLAAGIPTPKCYVIQSNSLNAFATGRNLDDSAVAVTTGLMEKLNREELEAVMAHEIAHVKNRDIRTMMLAAVLVGIIVLLSDVFLRSIIFGGGGNNRDGRLTVILFVVGIVLAILAPIFAEIIRLAISRKNEYAADARAAVLTRNPRALANALRKISNDPNPMESTNRAVAHLYIGSPYRKKRRFFQKYFSTHPPTDERIKRLEAM